MCCCCCTANYTILIFFLSVSLMRNVFHHIFIYVRSYSQSVHFVFSFFLSTGHWRDLWHSLTLMRYSLTGLLLVSRGGAQDSFTVREEKLITSGLPGVLGTSETWDGDMREDWGCRGRGFYWKCMKMFQTKQWRGISFLIISNNLLKELPEFFANLISFHRKREHFLSARQLRSWKTHF